MQSTEHGNNQQNSKGSKESVAFKGEVKQNGAPAVNEGAATGQDAIGRILGERMIGGGSKKAQMDSQTFERRSSSSSSFTASTSSRIPPTASSSSIPRSSLSSVSSSTSLNAGSIRSPSNPSSASSSTFPHPHSNAFARPHPAPPMSVLYPPNIPLASFEPPQPHPSSSSSHLRVQSHQSSTATPRNQTVSETRTRTTSAPQPTKASAIPQIPPFNRIANRARQIPDLNVNSTSSSSAAPQAQPNRAQASTVGRSALFTVTKSMRESDRDLLVEVRQRIRELAAAGALKIEADLENNTLRRLTHARLPTNLTALPQLIPHMKHLLLMPGITAQDYLYTFQLWHAYILKSQLVTFPICGPAVAAFLITETKLSDGQRPKIVWILEQYRKATLPAFEKLSEEPAWRKKMEKGWGDEAWLEWERFIELSKIKLGNWKIIEELAPPAAPPSSSSSSDPSIPSVASTSAQTVTQPHSFAPQRPPVSTNSSDKALGKRRVVEGEVSGPTLVRQPPPAPSVPSLGLNRQGQPRQVPFYKRKLPPLERQADEEFYGAVEECEAAIAAFKETRRKNRALSNSTTSIREPIPQLPPEPSPPVPPRVPTPPPPPFSDYTPSLVPASSSEPILTDSSAPPLFALLSSLPSSSASLHLTRFALGQDPAPLLLTANGLTPQPSASYPHFTLTPHHFLTYPKCLTLPSKLSQKDLDRTFGFAKGLDGHPQMVQLEKRLVGEGVGGDEREKRKKEELEKIVKSAIVESKPMEFVGGFEPRQPEAAKRAWERARRYGIEPVYSWSEPQVETSNADGESRECEKDVAKSVEGSGLVGAVEVKDKEIEVLSAKEAGEGETQGSDRKGKRKAIDEASAEAGEVRTDEADQSRAKSKKIRQLSNSATPSASPPSETTLTRSAPIPIVSISTPDSAPSPSLQTSSLEPASLQPQRPSLPPISASAPAVPQLQQRNRSKSTSLEPVPKMRRRPSITAPGSGVHPLALLYASQSPQFRQGARLKAAEIVAATKNGTIPAAKSPLIAAKVLTEGAVLPKASPRIGTNGSSKLAKSPRIVSKPLSPPLVPIPLAKEGEVNGKNGQEEVRKGDAMDIDDKSASTDEGEFERLHPPSISSQGSSALGVILELPSPHQQPATTPVVSHASPRPESPSASDPIPPIPIPEPSTRPSPPQPSSSTSLSSKPDTSAAPPPVASNVSKFSRFVGRLSSGFGLFAGGSQQAPEPALPTPTASPVTDRTAAPTTISHPDSPIIAESPTPSETPQIQNDDDTEMDELDDDTIPESIEEASSKPIEERLPSPVESDEDEDEADRPASPDLIAPNGNDTGKGKEKEVEVITLSSSTAPSLAAASSPTPSSSSSDSSSEPDIPLSTLRKPPKPKKKVPVPSRPVIKSKDKGKGKAVVEGKKVLKDHPLRHVSKKVLAASDPIFPFGRSY